MKGFVLVCTGYDALVSFVQEGGLLLCACAVHHAYVCACTAQSSLWALSLVDSVP